MHGVIFKYFYSHFEFTCQYIYIGLFVAAATVFPACYRGTTCGKADHPWQPYLVRGDHLRQHNLPQMVRGDQLWRGTNCGVTVLSKTSLPTCIASHTHIIIIYIWLHTLSIYGYILNTKWIFSRSPITGTS